MKRIIFSDEELNIRHDGAAATIAAERLAKLIREAQSEDALEIDWRDARHWVGKMHTEIIIHRLTFHRQIFENEIELSDNLISYFEDVSLEACTAMLAWFNWKSYGGRIVDDDRVRMNNDWNMACNLLKKNLESYAENLKYDSSVESYLDDAYENKKTALINKKAYWYHLAHPQNDSENNYIIAEEFVSRFYPLAKAVIKGEKKRIPELKKLILQNTDIVNFIEYSILKLQAIIPSPKSIRELYPEKEEMAQK